MMRISKYQPLTDYLQKCRQETCTLTFERIEELLDFPLPQSAYQYTVWWMNTNQTTCRHWLKAGYIITQYSMDQQYAVFQKNPEQAESYLSRIPEKIAREPQTHPKTQRREPATMEPDVSCDDLIAASQRYTDEIRMDPNARYLSWEHCYSYFQSHRKNPSEEEIDFMCLHLAWYLASWGMLRGGSFLLWKDYKVHKPVIRLLLSERYESLNNCTAEVLCKRDEVNKIMELSDKIISIYYDATLQNGEGRTASDTLVTKILLGTLGCTPAYDRYFKSGLKISQVATQSFSEKSLLQLADYYIKHKTKLESFRKRISEGRVGYTPMKIIDMCFWQTGFDADPNQNEDENE